MKGYNGSVELADQCVIVRKRLRGESRIPLASIASVEIGPAGVGMRFVRFATAASAQMRRPALGSHTEAASDPNALTFRSGRSAEFGAFAQAVEAARAAVATYTSDAGQPPPAGWYPDESGRSRWWDGRAWGPYAPPQG